MVYKCGEKPGKGYYTCAYCGKTEHLDDDTDTLAPCSNCNHCLFNKRY